MAKKSSTSGAGVGMGENARVGQSFPTPLESLVLVLSRSEAVTGALERVVVVVVAQAAAAAAALGRIPTTIAPSAATTLALKEQQWWWPGYTIMVFSS